MKEELLVLYFIHTFLFTHFHAYDCFCWTSHLLIYTFFLTAIAATLSVFFGLEEWARESVRKRQCPRVRACVRVTKNNQVSEMGNKIHVKSNE